MRPGISIILSPADRRRLEALVGDRNVAQKHVWRARIVLHSADGIGTNGIMRRTGKSKTCVWRWQERFAQEGYDGLLRDKTRPSRIPPLGPEVAERVVALTLSDPPAEATHWVAAMMAKATGISVSSVQRIWRAHGLRPHRVRQFKLSNDPDFVAKLRDVVGLYVDPPAHAIVLSVDEKSQIQALDRTQPGLPMKKGRLGTMTHDYKRHGTTTLFAALNVLEGKVIGRCMQRHRHQEFIRFLNAIEADIPAGKGVHVILDNYAAHKHAKVRAWLGRHERFTFHFVPTSCSWLNAVEGFFAKLSKRRLKRGVFRSIVDLQVAINRFLDETNDNPKALHLDRRSRQNHRRRQTRASSVRFDPLVLHRDADRSPHGRTPSRSRRPAARTLRCGARRCRPQAGGAASPAVRSATGPHPGDRRRQGGRDHGAGGRDALARAARGLGGDPLRSRGPLRDHQGHRGGAPGARRSRPSRRRTHSGHGPGSVQ